MSWSIVFNFKVVGVIFHGADCREFTATARNIFKRLLTQWRYQWWRQATVSDVTALVRYVIARRVLFNGSAFSKGLADLWIIIIIIIHVIHVYSVVLHSPKLFKSGFIVDGRCLSVGFMDRKISFLPRLDIRSPCVIITTLATLRHVMLMLEILTLISRHFRFCCIQTVGENDKLRIYHVIKSHQWRSAPLRILSCPGNWSWSIGHHTPKLRERGWGNTILATPITYNITVYPKPGKFDSMTYHGRGYSFAVDW